MAMKVQSNACRDHRVILVVGSCSIVEALIVFCPLIFFLIIVHWVIFIVDFPSLRSPR